MQTILPGALPSPPGAPQPDARINFSGNGGEFVGLCLRGALLMLVTFGFYRFWLATDIRRHLWSHSSVAGEPLEYTGRGKELLIGFLIALAIIVPVQLAYFLIGVEAERYQAFASIPLFLFFVLFGQFAIFRARKYRLTRTIWRGVRFWMSGSGWKYAFLWFGWSLLIPFTLGLAYPWMRASLERYKLENTYYGDLRGAFVGRPSEFFKRGFIIWLICIIPLFLLIAAAIATSPLFGLLGLPAPGARSVEIGVWLSVVGGVWMLLIPFIWPFFRALEWRWWSGGVRFGELSLKSDISGITLLKIYIKLVLLSSIILTAMLIVVTILVFGVAMSIGTDLINLDATNWMRAAQSIPLIITVVVGYLAIFLAIGVVNRFYLTREMWRVISTSITISRLETAERVAARGEAVNALGEGLADGLDVAGF